MPVEGRRAWPAPWPQVTAFQKNTLRDRGDQFTWVIRPQTAPTVRAAKAEGTERASAVVVMTHHQQTDASGEARVHSVG